jgi:hypothetical protein
MTHQEIAHLSQEVLRSLHESGSPAYVCNCCGAIYIREPYLDVKLGRFPGWII